jgi:pyruvate-ferredoxin/flavodoxin oxidoreductase
MTSSLIVAMTNSLVVVMTNEEGRLGYRLAIDKQTELAPALALKLAPQIGEDLVRALLDAPQITLAAARSRRKLLVG